MTRYAWTLFICVALAATFTTSCEISVDTDDLCPILTPYSCGNGACISQSDVCDGYIDCINGSDEAFCSTQPEGCSATEVTCADGSCISASHVCDGKSDCASGSDEAMCSVSCDPSVGFVCLDGYTIDCAWQCDGEPDCATGSDEFGC